MITELNVMMSLKPHPHVLKLIGCCSISGKSGPVGQLLILLLFLFYSTLKISAKFTELFEVRIQY